jgi:hypothetical protein
MLNTLQNERCHRCSGTIERGFVALWDGERWFHSRGCHSSYLSLQQALKTGRKRRLRKEGLLGLAVIPIALFIVLPGFFLVKNGFLFWGLTAIALGLLGFFYTEWKRAEGEEY